MRTHLLQSGKISLRGPEVELTTPYRPSQADTQYEASSQSAGYSLVSQDIQVDAEGAYVPLDGQHAMQALHSSHVVNQPVGIYNWKTYPLHLPVVRQPEGVLVAVLLHT